MATSQPDWGFFILMNNLFYKDKLFELNDIGQPIFPGVYMVTVFNPEIKKERILYIGSSSNIHKRTHCASHPYYKAFNRITNGYVCLRTHRTSDYLQLEKEMIRHYKPILNKHHKNASEQKGHKNA